MEHDITGTDELVRTWTGLHSQMTSLFTALSKANYVRNVRLQQHGATSTVTATSSLNVSESRDTLELDFVETHSSIFNHPYFATIADADVQSIKRYVAEYQNEIASNVQAKVPNTTVYLQAFLRVFTDAKSQQAFWLWFQGIETYQIELPVIVLNRVVGPDWSSEFAVADMGTLWTAAQVSDYTGLAASVLAAIPDPFNGQTPSPGGNVSWTIGWRYKQRQQFQADGSIALQESWEFGLAPTLLNRLKT